MRFIDLFLLKPRGPIKRDMAPTNTNGKRPIYSIDLTSDDDPPTQRKIHRSHPLDNSAESERDPRAAHDDEEDADEIIILSQDGNNIVSENYELFGREPKFLKVETMKYNTNP